ncbi:hypothetical protein ABZ540_19740 [Nocardia xishanensis]
MLEKIPGEIPDGHLRLIPLTNVTANAARTAAANSPLVGIRRLRL